MSAQVQISQLPSAGTITGTELVPIVQNGQTVKTTTGAIAASPSQTQTFLTKNQELTLPNSRYLSTGTGLGLTDGGATSFYRITLNGVSGSLETSSGGIIVKNSASTVVGRTLAVSGAGLGISNADGTGGDPTFQLTGVAAAVANLGGTGLMAVVGGTTVAGRQITGVSGQISVANGNGSGDPTIGIADNPTLPGTGAVKIPTGNNSQQPIGTAGQLRFNTDTSSFYGFDGTSWLPFSLGAGVGTFSAGGTGLTPNVPTTGAVVLGGILNAANGGTGANTLTGYVKGNGTLAMTASATIPNTDITGLGTMSTQNANNVAITGGTTSGVAATGGSLNNTPVGNVTPSTGAFTSISTTSGTVSATPTADTDLVNKLYVDNQVAAGIDIHTAVRAEFPEANGNINATYNNGAAGVGATLTNAGAQAALVVDGVTVSVGDRVLVYNQTNAYENGVYTVTNTGSGSTNWVLTRATDANTYGANSPTKLGQGSYFFVQEGVTGAGESYVCNTVGPITFGTTAITFALFSQSILYTAGTGLTLSPSYQFSITPTGTAGTYGSASQVPVLTTNASGQVTGVTNTSIAISAGAVSGLAPSATTDTTNASNITSGTLGTSRLTGSYTGITGVGTLTAGTWNANAIGVGYGGTGLTATPTNGQLPIGNGTGYSLATLTAGTNVTITNTAGGIQISATPSYGGTVTSVDVSGGTTGISFSGGPVTTSGTITMAGTLNVANGGTGATTLTGYVKGNGTSAMTSSTTIPNTDITGLGTISTQNASNVAITGGAIDGTTVGATTATTVRGTTITATTQFSGSGAGLTSIPNSATTATDANTASAIVARDASGNFSAGTITAALNGNASTATSATTATTATNATNTAIASNSTNADYFITVVSTNTGNLPQLVASGLTANPSTGKITGGIAGGTF